MVEQKNTVDLRSVLKNAVEKGATLEAVKVSFVNAGYSKSEVDAASASLNNVQQVKQTVAASAPVAKQPVQAAAVKPKKKFFTRTKVIIFLAVAVVIIGGAFLIGLS